MVGAQPMTHQTFPKPTSRIKTKNRTVTKLRKAKRRTSEEVKRDVYSLVDKRDQGQCKVCGFLHVLFPHEHHHIKARSLGGKHTTANVVTLCRHCHYAATNKRLIITGNADDALVISWPVSY